MKCKVPDSPPLYSNLPALAYSSAYAPPLTFHLTDAHPSSKSPHCETFSGLPTGDTTGKKQLIHMNSTIYCVVSQCIKQAADITKLETKGREGGMCE